MENIYERLISEEDFKKLNITKEDTEYMISTKRLKEDKDYIMSDDTLLLNINSIKKIEDFILKKDKFIAYLNDVYKKTGKVPSRRGTEYSWKIVDFFRTNWNDILVIAGIDRLYAPGFSKEDIKTFIKNWSKENGRSPTKSDIMLAKKNGAYIPHPQIIGTLFGSWNKMLQECGLDIVKNSHRGNFKDMTDKQLLDILKKEITRIGSVSSLDYVEQRSKNSPSLAYYIKRFDGWKNAVKNLK